MTYRAFKITYTDHAITTTELRVCMYVVYKYDPSNGSKYWIKQTNNERGNLTPTFELSSPYGEAMTWEGNMIESGKMGVYSSRDRAKQQISLRSTSVVRKIGAFTEMSVDFMHKEEYPEQEITNDTDAEKWLRNQR